jgi:hypothetical protein
MSGAGSNAPGFCVRGQQAFNRPTIIVLNKTLSTMGAYSWLVCQSFIIKIAANVVVVTSNGSVCVCQRWSCYSSENKVKLVETQVASMISCNCRWRYRIKKPTESLHSSPRSHPTMPPLTSISLTARPTLMNSCFSLFPDWSHRFRPYCRVQSWLSTVE